MAESTPLSYKLNFKTAEQSITTPNLFAPYTEYHVDLSAVNSLLTVPLENLVLSYQTTSSSALRISAAPKTAGTTVLCDIRRLTIYNASTIESQTSDNTSISARTVLDEIVYTSSQESHSMKIRQQDPETKLWSLCEITSFISKNAARTSVTVRFLEHGVSYLPPETVYFKKASERTALPMLCFLISTFLIYACFFRNVPQESSNTVPKSNEPTAFPAATTSKNTIASAENTRAFAR